MPQFLYEAGYGCAAFPERAGAIGVTQPRRVAAVSTATRVAQELGEGVGQTVGYQVSSGALNSFQPMAAVDMGNNDNRVSCNRLFCLEASSPLAQMCLWTLTLPCWCVTLAHFYSRYTSMCAGAV